MNTPNPTLTLITGGSRGLGRNTAEHVARAGGDVILTYRSGADEAAAAVATIQALGRKAVALQLDTGKVSTFAAFADRVRGVLASEWQRDSFDHLVNNAGHGDTAPLAETTEAQFDRLVDVHFKGVFFLTQALLPLLADGGRIVNFSSGLTRFAYPGYGAYAAAKGAVETLTAYMAKEFGPRGITANVVAPGAIATDFGGGLVRALSERRPGSRCFGVAGPRMVEAGCEAWHSTEELAVMGLAEILKHLPRLLRLRRELVDRFLATRPDVFVGIDSPEFNLRVAAQLKASGVPTVQYVSPETNMTR